MVSLVNITMLVVGNYNYTGDQYNYTGDQYNYTGDKYNCTMDNSDKYNYTMDNSDKHNTTSNCGKSLSDEGWETVSHYR